jgi:hypothetical protein
LTELSKYTKDPETLSIINAMIMMNMDGNGLSDVQKYFRRKLVKAGVIVPNEKEREDLIQEIQNTPDDANTIYLKAAAENEKAKALKAQADTILSQARADSERADTVETLAGVERENYQQAIDTIEKLGPRVFPNGQ